MKNHGVARNKIPEFTPCVLRSLPMAVSDARSIISPMLIDRYVNQARLYRSKFEQTFDERPLPSSKTAARISASTSDRYTSRSVLS